MKKYEVTLCRVEHCIIKIEIEANTKEAAEQKAQEYFDDDDLDIMSEGDCVHAEEFINEVREIKELLHEKI